MASDDNAAHDSLTQGLNMLRINSNSPFTEEDIEAPLDLPTNFNQEEFMGEFSLCYQADPNLFVTHDQDASAISSFNFYSDPSNEFSSHLPSSSGSMLRVARSSSIQRSESDSRSSRRHQEQASDGAIAPKVNALKLSPTPKMVRFKSEDSSVQVSPAVSRKLPYQRPQRPKLFCKLCNDRPDGFRGDHELQRHINRAHPYPGSHKFWICEDVYGDGELLKNCKVCRTKKRYDKCYNAAAHLRRAHFKYKGGRKRPDNWPAIDVLQKEWMREIEEVIDNQSPPVDLGSSAAVDFVDEKTAQRPVDSADDSVFISPFIEDFASLEPEEIQARSLLECDLDYETMRVPAEEALFHQFITPIGTPKGGAEAIAFPLNTHLSISGDPLSNTGRRSSV